MMHGGWWFWDSIGDGDDTLLSDIPPEWRSFNPWGGNVPGRPPVRTTRSKVTFSSLDGPEVYTFSVWRMMSGKTSTLSLTHGTTPTTATKVLRTASWWRMSPSSRPSVPGLASTMDGSADVVRPSATVVIVPVVMNKRYMQAGLDGNTTGQTTVPVMEQAAGKRDTDEPVNIP